MKTARRFVTLALMMVFAVLVCTVAAFAVSSASAEEAAAEPATAVSASFELGEEDEALPLADDTTSDGTTTPAPESSTPSDGVSGKAIAASVAIGLAALGGAIGMGIAIAKAMDGISRQPEAANNIRSTMMLGLVFVETVVIYALIVSVLLIFVL